MNVLGIDDELAEEYAPIPPDFTKGYPLPDGWKVYMIQPVGYPAAKK